MEQRALARLADQKFVAEKVQQFRSEHSDWKDLAAFLMTKHTAREFSKKKAKEKVKDKMKKVETNVKASETLIQTYLGGKVPKQDTESDEEDADESKLGIKANNKSEGNMDGTGYFGKSSGQDQLKSNINVSDKDLGKGKSEKSQELKRKQSAMIDKETDSESEIESDDSNKSESDLGESDSDSGIAPGQTMQVAKNKHSEKAFTDLKGKAKGNGTVSVMGKNKTEKVKSIHALKSDNDCEEDYKNNDETNEGENENSDSDGNGQDDNSDDDDEEEEEEDDDNNDDENEDDDDDDKDKSDVNDSSNIRPAKANIPPNEKMKSNRILKEKIEGEMIVKKINLKEVESADEIPSILTANAHASKKTERKKTKDVFFACSDDEDDNEGQDIGDMASAEADVNRDDNFDSNFDLEENIHSKLNTFSTTFVGSLNSDKMMECNEKQFRTNEEWKRLRQERNSGKDR